MMKFMTEDQTMQCPWALDDLSGLPNNFFMNQYVETNPGIPLFPILMRSLLFEVVDIQLYSTILIVCRELNLCGSSSKRGLSRSLSIDRQSSPLIGGPKSRRRSNGTSPWGYWNGYLTTLQYPGALECTWWLRRMGIHGE